MNQDCNEVAPHIAAKGKIPSTDEVPAVHTANLGLADVSPTGYAPHTVDCSKTSGDGIDAGDWTSAGQDAEGFPVVKDSPDDVTGESYNEER